MDSNSSSSNGPTYHSHRFIDRVEGYELKVNYSDPADYNYDDFLRVYQQYTVVYGQQQQQQQLDVVRIKLSVQVKMTSTNYSVSGIIAVLNSDVDKFLTVHPWWLVVEEPFLWQYSNHTKYVTSEGTSASVLSSTSSTATLSVTLDRVHNDWVKYFQQYSVINYPSNLTQCDLLPMVRLSVPVSVPIPIAIYLLSAIHSLIHCSLIEYIAR